MTKTSSPTNAGELTVLLPSWRLHLEASNLSPRTHRAYTDDGALLAAFLTRQGHAHRSRQHPARAPEGVASRPILLTARVWSARNGNPGVSPAGSDEGSAHLMRRVMVRGVLLPGTGVRTREPTGTNP